MWSLYIKLEVLPFWFVKATQCKRPFGECCSGGGLEGGGIKLRVKGTLNLSQPHPCLLPLTQTVSACFMDRPALCFCIYMTALLIHRFVSHCRFQTDSGGPPSGLLIKPWRLSEAWRGHWHLWEFQEWNTHGCQEPTAVCS